MSHYLFSFDILNVPVRLDSVLFQMFFDLLW